MPDEMSHEEVESPDFSWMGEGETIDEAIGNEPAEKETEEEAGETDEGEDLAEESEEEEETESEDTPEGEGDTADPWEEIRKEFPDLTKKELVRMMERDKNLEADYTRKTQKLAEERRAFEQLENEFRERIAPLEQQLSFLQSDEGRRALEIAKLQSDPVQWERLNRAYQQIQLTPDEATNAILSRHKAELDAQMKAMNEKLESIKKAEFEQRQAELVRMVDGRLQQTKVFQAVGDDPGLKDLLTRQMDHLMQIEVERRIAAKEPIGDPKALADKSAAELERIFDAMFSKRLESWKKQKKSAKKVTPTGSKGGSAPPRSKAKKIDANMTSDEVADYALKVLDDLGL